MGCTMSIENRFMNGKIYEIWNSDLDIVYIGSTVKTLKQRLSKHLSAWGSWKQTGKGYCSSYRIFQTDNYFINLIDDFPSKSRKELEKEEGSLIRQHDCVNLVIPGRTQKEWLQDNKEQVTEYQSQWYLNNKEQIAEQKKLYYIDNKEQIAKQRKLYYIDNKEKLKLKITCQCGSVVRKSDIRTHERSMKHQRLMSAQ